MNRTLLYLIAMLMAASYCTAQQTPVSPPTLHWWGKTDEFLNQQSIRTFDFIDQVLVANPPQIEEPPIRKMALLSLDNLLHDTANDQRPSLGHFFQKRIKSIAGQLKTDPPKTGAVIYKLYNHSFIVRTPSTTIAFDLISNQSSRISGLHIPNDVLREIVRSCDILFVSHFHGDHADSLVAGMFTAEGKPVVASPDLWNGIHEKILHPSRQINLPEVVVLSPDRPITVQALPGHQGVNILNNVYAVTTPEGLTFVHTGDQSNHEDLDWIDQISKTVKTDVLLVNCWTNQLVRTIRGFNPRLVVTGHENEMDHSVDHREPYWLTYERLKGNTHPNILMSWGESYHFRP